MNDYIYYLQSIGVKFNSIITISFIEDNKTNKILLLN